MKRSYLLWISAILLLIIISIVISRYVDKTSAKQSDSMSILLSSKKDQALYMMGALYARQLTSLALSKEEWQLIKQGIEERTNPKLTPVEGDQLVQEFIAARNRERLSLLKARGQEFKKDFLKHSDAKETKSGLAYRIIQNGGPKTPSLYDTVKFDYHGTLTNGTIVGSSFAGKQAVETRLDALIQGWIEGLQLIGEGGEIELVVPSHLAYGDAGARPDIAGGDTLHYRIILRQILSSTPSRKTN